MEKLTKVMDQDTQAISDALKEIMDKQMRIEWYEKVIATNADQFALLAAMLKWATGRRAPGPQVILYDKKSEQGHSAVLDVTLQDSQNPGIEDFLKLMKDQWTRLMEPFGATVEYVDKNLEGKSVVRISFLAAKDFNTAYQSAVNILESLPEKMEIILRGCEASYSAAVSFHDTVSEERIPIITKKLPDGSPRFTIGDGTGYDAITRTQEGIVQTAWQDYCNQTNEAEATMQKARS